MIIVPTKPFDPKLVAVHARVQEAFPSRAVVVAGGAMRDWFCDRPRKDIDIFVESRRDRGGFPETLKKLTAALGKPTRYMAHVEYLQWSREVTGFANWNLDGEDVQVVGVDYRPLCMKNVLARFDIGICQIGYDGNQIECATAFTSDVANNTMTMVRCDSVKDWDRCHSRVERLIAEKYAGWVGVFDEGYYNAAKCEADEAYYNAAMCEAVEDLL